MKVSKKIEKIQPNTKNLHPQNNLNTSQNYAKLLQSLKNATYNLASHKRNFSDVPRIYETSPDTNINKHPSYDKKYQYAQKE